MGKKMGILESRSDSVYGLYKLRNELNKLGEVPKGDAFYDYFARFLETVSRFEDENYVRSFKGPVTGDLQAKTFKRIKRIFISYLEFFGRGGYINHTQWREEVKLENIYLMYVENGKKIIKTAYEWKNSEKKHKEKHTEKIRLHMKSKMDEFIKSLNKFIETFE